MIDKIDAGTDENLAALERLLIGPDSQDFQNLEKLTSEFCPFEAIGMIDQEIRHAHFLSYLLDPNRPHGFHDQLLKEFLHEVILQSQSGEVNISSLSVHYSSFNNAVVYRERSNIDLLIEIPSGSTFGIDKGIVLVVEMKIRAKESGHQLDKYSKYIQHEYPASEWIQIFAFLTLDATAALHATHKSWTPVSMPDVLSRFDNIVQRVSSGSEAAVLYKQYSKMMRRHLIMDDEIAELAKKIWSRHATALNILYDYKPDLQSEVFEWLMSNSDKFVEDVFEETGFTLVRDTSTRRILRFAVREWLKIEGFCDTNQSFVDTGSLVVLELADWGGRIRCSIVLGPGEDEVRQKFYAEVLLSVDAKRLSIARRTTTLPQFKHLSSIDVQTQKSYEKALESDEPSENLGRNVYNRAKEFMKNNIHEYDRIIRHIFEPGFK